MFPLWDRKAGKEQERGKENGEIRDGARDAIGMEGEKPASTVTRHLLVSRRILVCLVTAPCQPAANRYSADSRAR